MKDEEELAPLEELEELEVLESLPDADEASVGPAEEPMTGPLPPFARAGVRDLARSFEPSRVPFAILDASFEYAYRNPALKTLLKNYRYPEGSTFLGLVARATDQETALSLRHALSSAQAGYAWTGLVAHKSREHRARITKLLLNPLWPEGARGGRPDAYAAYFDDITEENKRNVRAAFDSLLKASLKKDNDTGKHIERVNLYASRLTQELYRDPRWPEVDPDFIEDIGYLAAMHDVGKIGTPDDILNKGGPLNDFEWAIMKEHTINGAYILDAYPNPMAKQIALAHHERWDGSGYPYNLERDMIPLAARVVAIADVYDALRMKRSYKEPLGHETAIAMIAKERGTHFDPALVDRLGRLHADFGRIYEDNAD